MNAAPLLRAKVSTYQGATVYTADSVLPSAWWCSACGKAFGDVPHAERVAEACCTAGAFDGGRVVAAGGTPPA